jgi:GAF domain/Sel1 repeat/PilZ domain
MDRSIRRLPDPIAAATSSCKERRRCVRQKLHTPVYASFNGPETGLVVDLSELLDLHEDGFAVQTSERLEMHRAVTVCLDLPETKNYIHGNGEVIWSDDTGRSGIRFSALTDNSRRILKEWLFANLLIACSNQAARAEQLARHEDENRDRATLEDLANPKLSNVVPISDRITAISSSDVVGNEPAAVDVELQLVAERAMTATGASGAALALLTNDEIICRASVGEIAPPLGTRLSATEGLSAECVRTGLLVSCEDMQNDARVDPAIGRELGIGSLMAAAIVSDFSVVGVLEVFSPQANAFTQDHATTLQRLVETIPQTPRTNSHVASAAKAVASLGLIHENLTFVTQQPSQEPEVNALDRLSSVAVAERPVPTEDASPVPRQEAALAAGQTPEPAVPGTSRLVYRALLGLVIAVVVVVVGYVVGPAVASGMKEIVDLSKSPVRGRGETSKGSSAASANNHWPRAKSLAELRKVADQGDADGQWQMGVRYHNGEDVPQDDTEAMRWFQLAAEQGNVEAQSALGSYYWAGRGVPEDLSKAYFWSAIALAQGDDNSKGRLEGLASQMTREQVSAARQQAEAWIRSHSETAKSAAN